MTRRYAIEGRVLHVTETETRKASTADVWHPVWSLTDHKEARHTPWFQATVAALDSKYDDQTR